MLLGHENSNEVHGRFYEFQYKTIVQRNSKSEHFGCFKGNDLTIFEMVTSIFCYNMKSFLHVVSTWKDLFGIYSYVPIGSVNERKSYTSSEVVDLIYSRNNFKYCPYYNDLYEYIK
jgi:hypothetical protein